MTTPQQPPPSQTPPPSSQAAADAALAAAVAAALLTAVNVQIAMAALTALAKAAKLRAESLEAALGITMDFPPGQEGFYGAATREMARTNLLRRAQFVVSAAHRIDHDLIYAISHRENLVTALSQSVRRERRYYAQHLVAIWGRAKAGAQVDSAAMQYGRLLGWHTVQDKRTSPECLAANGKNFYADHMPVIGYPGAVHVHCRCLPGAPFPRGAILPSYGLRLRRAA